MQQAFTATTEATPEDLFTIVGDLTTYPNWLDLVDAVQADTTDPGLDGDADAEPAWLVTLKGRVGPFSRSKRLRMVRTLHKDGAVRFERQELDGKDHSAWVLAAEVTPGADDAGEDAGTSSVDVSLSYDGTMWSGLLDGVLDAAASRATKKLQAYVKP